MIGMVALSVNKQKKIDYLFSKYGQKRVMDTLFWFYYNEIHYLTFKDMMD